MAERGVHFYPVPFTNMSIVDADWNGYITLCKSGTPRVTEDSVHVLHSDGRVEYLCEDEARARLDQLGLWPINGNEIQRRIDIRMAGTSADYFKALAAHSFADSLAKLSDPSVAPAEKLAEAKYIAEHCKDSIVVKQMLELVSDLLGSLDSEVALQAALFLAGRQTEVDMRIPMILGSALSNSTTVEVDEKIAILKALEATKEWWKDADVGIKAELSIIARRLTENLNVRVLAASLIKDIFPETAAGVATSIDWQEFVKIHEGGGILNETETIKLLDLFNGVADHLTPMAREFALWSLNWLLLANAAPFEAYGYHPISYDIDKLATELMLKLDTDKGLLHVKTLLYSTRQNGAAYGMVKALTNAYMSYKDSWDGNRIMIGRLLIYALQNGHNGSCASKISRVLCAYTHPELKADLENLMELQDNGNKEWDPQWYGFTDIKGALAKIDKIEGTVCREEDDYERDSCR